MPLNIYDTHYMLAAVQEMPLEHTFFKNRYFPTDTAMDVFGTSKVLGDYREGTQKIAPFVVPRIGSLPVGLNLVVFYLNGFIGSAMLLSIALLPLPEFKSVKMLASALITIVGVQSIFLGLTGLLFKGAERIIPYAILISFVILWLCYLVHLLIGPLYTPKKK